MAKKTSYLSVRISPETREALEDIARNRCQGNEDVRLADLVREALDEYLAKQR